MNTFKKSLLKDELIKINNDRRNSFRIFRNKRNVR